MKISRDLALKILNYQIQNPKFYFPFLVMCKGYGAGTDDEDFLEVVPKDDYEDLLEDSTYDTFELWENLQNLDLQTIELLSKGSLELILNENAISLIEKSAKDYRDLWKLDMCESAKIEEYGLNEFFGGKAEGFEESLEILKRSYKKLS